MGEPPGFREFVETHSRGLLRTAWLLTGAWPDAEDLVQVALAKSRTPAAPRPPITLPDGGGIVRVAMALPATAPAGQPIPVGVTGLVPGTAGPRIP